MRARMRVISLALRYLIPIITVAGGAPLAKADFELDSQSVTIDPLTKVAEFSLTFNQAPDFATLDSLGRPTDSFQVNFDGNYIPPSDPQSTNAQTTAEQGSLTSIVRGDEIHIANDIPIRLPTGDGGVSSGGWGPAVDAVPFSLIGDTVSFSVPAADLGWTGHSYQYDAFSLVDGGQTASDLVTAVPTPKALTGGLAGLVVVAGASRVIRKRSAERLS